MMDHLIIPECYVDTNLNETLVPPDRGYNHQKGCGTVARLMQGKLKDNFALGIIDKDKQELKYANEFEVVAGLEALSLLRHKNKQTHHYLILINPAVEKWIVSTAHSASISLKDFNLPDDWVELAKRTKKMTSKNDPAFKCLFQEMKRLNPNNIRILTEWISYLKSKSFASKTDEIKTITAQCL